MHRSSRGRRRPASAHRPPGRCTARSCSSSRSGSSISGRSDRTASRWRATRLKIRRPAKKNPQPRAGDSRLEWKNEGTRSGHQREPLTQNRRFTSTTRYLTTEQQPLIAISACDGRDSLIEIRWDTRARRFERLFYRMGCMYGAPSLHMLGRCFDYGSKIIKEKPHTPAQTHRHTHTHTLGRNSVVSLARTKFVS